MGQGTPRMARVVAGLLAAVTLAGCATVGRPGGYPDTLFVVMKAQADLSAPAFEADVTARRADVYHLLVAFADRSQAPLRHDLAALYLPYTPYYLVNGLAVEGNAAIRDWLVRRPDVDEVLLAPRPAPVPLPTPSSRQRATVDGRAQPNLRAIGADRAWANGITGPGVTVGIADTGVDGNHPALRGAFRGADAGWYDPARGSTFPTDPDGPGTQLAGAALGSNGIGVAPGARWIGCAEPPVNLADPATYLGCLQFMLAPFPLGGDPMRDGRPDLSADILLGAWGCPQPSACDTETMQPAVRALSAAGIFMVSAGGTAGGRCGLFGPPQLRYPQVLTVGTYPPGGPVADIPLSAVGRPDVVAPGTDVVSAVPGGGYGRISGPPVAAAEVAGIVALLWAASPGLVGNLVRTRELLLDTATPVPEGLGCFNRAAPPGRLVNADEAVRAARLD